MRPDSDPARQRTVAELLAQHGGVDTAVPRRRRRDDPDSDAPDVPAPREPETVRDLTPPGLPGVPSPWTPPTPGAPVRPGGFATQPVLPRPSPAAENGPGATTRLGSVPHGSTRRLPGPSTGPGPVLPEPRRDRPFLPNALRGPGAPPVPSGLRTVGPWTPPAGPVGRREVPDPGPATGAWNPFTDDASGAEPGDGSSATVPGSPAVRTGAPRFPAVPARLPVEQHPDDDDPRVDEPDGALRTGGFARGDAALDDPAFDDPAFDDAAFDDPAPDDPGPPLARSWAGVVAQWLTGAVVGAVLWVLFRYLWRGLPVVACAAALLVTAGLVVGVRQLLHDVDRRTTAFAVLVGLLLTASPAVLVVLGR
jgi:hypothetical protein